MKKKLFVNILFVLVIGSVELLGQGMYGGDIQFDIDLARFRASDDWSYLEIYFSIPRKEFEHRKVENHYQATFEMGVNLFIEDSLVAEKIWKGIDRIDSLSALKSWQRVNTQSSFFLNEGRFKLRARVTDLSQKKGGWYEQNLEIVPFSRTVLDISDIQLATQIVPDTSRGRLVKNGYRIVSNPTGMYGLELPLLYYYCEIYNLSSRVEGDDSTYSVRRTVLDVQGNVVKEILPKVRVRQAASVVDVEMINVITLLSGHYRLCVEVMDKGTGETVSKEKSFFVYRQADFIEKEQSPVVTERRIVDEYKEMGEEELDALFEQCGYVATSKEKKIYKKLDIEGKKEFMRSFWRKRDSNLLTDINEFKQEYLEKVALANATFSSGNKKGWKTDQGRILIKYGKPDEVERYPSSIDQKVHQFWHYYGIEGGIYFVFVDVRGFGEMLLVHSTARDELQDYDWQRWLK